MELKRLFCLFFFLQKTEQGGGRLPEVLYTLVETNRRNVPRFQTEGVDYRLRVANLNVTGLSDVLKALNTLFANILAGVTAGMAPRDQVRFVMHSPQLSFPISLPFMPLEELTPRRILFEVERVLQSHENFVLRDDIHLNLVRVKVPVGGAWKRSRGGVKLERRLRDKQCILRVKNKDELCLALAIVVGVARLKGDPCFKVLKEGRKEQRTRAMALHDRAGVPWRACGLEDVATFQRWLSPEVQLVVVSSDHFDSVVYKGPEARFTLFLLFHDAHFDVITSMPAFCGKVYYCVKCEKGYNTEDYRHHKCGLKCLACHTMGCADLNRKDGWLQCADCLRMMRGSACLTNHKLVSAKGGRSVCSEFRMCDKCQKIAKVQGDRPHRCGQVRCVTCDKYKPENHLCFMTKPKQKKKESKEKNFLFFYFECIQETGRHVPNLVVVQNAAGREWVFSGPNTCNEFCDWLFGGANNGTVCVAHNFKGYDSYFILKYLYDNRVLPKLIMNGAKVMELKVTECDIRMIDSLNFLPMPLAQFPKTFGLTELAKGYFPHFFNTKNNQTYVGPLPDVEYFDPDGMKPKARVAFLAWHAEKRSKEVVFDFRQELIKYCRSDVDILRRCCLSFSDTVKGLCGLNPFEHCITIASLCNLIYRSMFLQEDTIGIIPQLGYRKTAQQSAVAYRWLAYMGWREGVYIQHGQNVGEKRLGPYLLDGWCEVTATAYEFNGCFFHGCPACFPGETMNPVSGVSMHELYMRTCTKRDYLAEQGCHVVTMWECEFSKLLERCPEAAAYVTGLEDIVDPLNPRDAFTGGRTNASRLLVKTAGTGVRVKYIDFTSLYPDIKQKRCVSGGASDHFVRQPRRGGRASILWTREVRRGAASSVVASRVALPVQSKADVCFVSHVRGDGAADAVLP